MKTRILALMMTFILVATNINAAGYSNCNTDCYDPCDPCMEWTVFGEWLYMKPYRCGLEYVMEREGFTHVKVEDVAYEYPIYYEQLGGKGKQRCVSPDWNSGYRVGVSVKCDNDWLFDVKYTSFDNTTTDSVDLKKVQLGKALFATRVHPFAASDLFGGDDEDPTKETTLFAPSKGFAYAKAAYNIDLDIIDIELGKQVEWGCDFHLKPFFGTRIAFIDEELSTLYQVEKDLVDEAGKSETKVKESIKLDAYGPTLGAEVEWVFCDCFTLFGRASGGIYIGEFDRRFSEIEKLDSLKFAYDNEGKTFEDYNFNECAPSKCIVSSNEMAFGVRYEFCNNDCGTFNAQLGYEIQNWYNMQDFLNFTDDLGRYHTARNGSTLGFSSLVLRLEASF